LHALPTRRCSDLLWPSSWWRWGWCCRCPGRFPRPKAGDRFDASIQMHLAVMGAAAPTPPGEGSFAPRGEGLFRRRKSHQKGAGDTPVPDFCLNRSISDLGHLRAESGFYHLIYSRAIADTSASGPVKEIPVSRVLVRGDMLIR